MIVLQLKKAKKEGRLAESLLDRRMKLKRSVSPDSGGATAVLTSVPVIASAEILV